MSDKSTSVPTLLDQKLEEASRIESVPITGETSSQQDLDNNGRVNVKEKDPSDPQADKRPPIRVNIDRLIMSMRMLPRSDLDNMPQVDVRFRNAYNQGAAYLLQQRRMLPLFYRDETLTSGYLGPNTIRVEVEMAKKHWKRIYSHYERWQVFGTQESGVSFRLSDEQLTHLIDHTPNLRFEISQIYGHMGVNRVSIGFNSLWDGCPLMVVCGGDRERGWGEDDESVPLTVEFPTAELLGNCSHLEIGQSEWSYLIWKGGGTKEVLGGGPNHPPLRCPLVRISQHSWGITFEQVVDYLFAYPDGGQERSLTMWKLLFETKEETERNTAARLKQMIQERLAAAAKENLHPIFSLHLYLQRSMEEEKKELLPDVEHELIPRPPLTANNTAVADGDGNGGGGGKAPHHCTFVYKAITDPAVKGPVIRINVDCK